MERVLESRRVGGLTWKHVAQAIHSMAKVLEQVAQFVGDVMVEEEVSRIAGRHLPGDQDVDFTTMILVVRQAFVDLGAREVREAVGDEAVDGLAIL